MAPKDPIARRVNVLVNATTVRVGGAVQVALSFIEYAARLGPGGPSFLFAVSVPLFDALPAWCRQDPRLRVFPVTPAHPWKGRKTRRDLLALEEEFAPDIVYSISFPSYVVFKHDEIGRYTSPWEICDLSTARQVMSCRERLVRMARSSYRFRWARHARYFETQTEVAKAGIVTRLRVSPEHVLVLPNSANPRFTEASARTDGPSQLQDCRRVFCLSAAHRHKNLQIVPQVAAILRCTYGLPCRFILTLPLDSGYWREIALAARRLRVQSWVENAGPLHLDDCIQRYREADCLFLPTLAEVFSATYLEAMAMKVPIVTSDLDFAHTICDDAAIYHDPLSAEAAAKSIHSVFTDDRLRLALIEKGRRRLSAFPDAETKFQSLLEWIIRLAGGGNRCSRVVGCEAGH